MPWEAAAPSQRGGGSFRRFFQSPFGVPRARLKMAVATVDISSVRKTFGPTVALGGASLKAYSAEVHAIIGGNGSGKSTLAKVISGVLIPDSGQVSILGRSATSPIEARALGIANVFQEVLVADECSVLDNLYLGADNLFSPAMGQEDKSAKAAALMRAPSISTCRCRWRSSRRQWVTIGRPADRSGPVLDRSRRLSISITSGYFAEMRQLKAADLHSHRDPLDLSSYALPAMRRCCATAWTSAASKGGNHQRILERWPARSGEGAAWPTAVGRQAQPLLQVEAGRVWHDGDVDFTLHPGEMSASPSRRRGERTSCAASPGSACGRRQDHHRKQAEPGCRWLLSARGSVLRQRRPQEGGITEPQHLRNLLMPVYRSTVWAGCSMVNRRSCSRSSIGIRARGQDGERPI